MSTKIVAKQHYGSEINVSVHMEALIADKKTHFHTCPNESICIQPIYCYSNMNFYLPNYGRKHFGKRKCWLLALSPFFQHVFRSTFSQGRQKSTFCSKKLIRIFPLLVVIMWFLFRNVFFPRVSSKAFTGNKKTVAEMMQSVFARFGKSPKKKEILVFRILFFSYYSLTGFSI